jgi:WD40 repeat protein
MDWSSDGRTLAAGMMDKVVHLWRERLEGSAEAWSYAQGHRQFVPPEWELVATLNGHGAAVNSVAWRPNDTSCLASGSGDLTVRLWRRGDGSGGVGDADEGIWKEIGVLRGQHESITSVAWSPDGSMLLSASGDRSIVIWDPERHREKNRLLGHEDSVTAATWFTTGSDFRILSASKDRSAIIWELGNSGEWEVGALLKGHTDSLTAAFPAPEGNKVVTGSHDRSVRIWSEHRPGEWQQIDKLDGHTERVTSVAWSPDGQKIVSTSSDRVTRIWRLSSKGGWKANRLGLGAVTKAIAPGKPSLPKKDLKKGKNSLVDWGGRSSARNA